MISADDKEKVKKAYLEEAYSSSCAKFFNVDKNSYLEEAYSSSCAKFFNVDKNSYLYKELEKSFENFWKKITT